MKIGITNFMCHSGLEIEVKDLSIISGQNGSGKSAIFHALNWLINGGTNNFITTGEKQSSVTLELEGKKYKRTTEYAVYVNDNKISIQKDSLKELGIELNLEFLSQFDKLFLLNETPKARAEQLNEMFEIEKLETAVEAARKDIREINKSMKDAEEVLEIARERANKISLNLKKIKSLAAVTEAYIKLKTVAEEITQIKTVNLSYELELLDKVHNLIQAISLAKELSQCVIKPIVPTIDIDKIKYNIQVIELLNFCLNIKGSIKHMEPIEQVKYLDTVGITENILKIIEKIKYIDFIEDLPNIELNQLLRITALEIHALEKDEIRLNQLASELIDLNKKLEKEVCPLCKQKI